MGRPKINVGLCSRCNKDCAWTKGLCRRCYKVEYYATNKNVERVRRRLFNKTISDKISLRKREREKSDIVYKLANRLRTRLNESINGKSKRGSAVDDLGCSIEELKKHLESQWKVGMSWDNWSKGGWHIDHIRPLSSFDLTDPKQLKEACRYTNLQPLWAFENLSKGDKVGPEEK